MSRKAALQIASLAAAAAVLTGCAVPFPVYTISTTNVTSIRAAKKPLDLGDFAGAQNSVSCRLQPISPDGGRTFAQYIRSAFNDEVVIAGPQPPGKPSRLSMQVRSIEVDCGVSTGSWSIEADVVIEGQRPFTVKTVKTFDGNFMGTVVLQRAYQAFVPSVQQFITEVMAHPSYKAEFAGTSRPLNEAPRTR